MYALYCWIKGQVPPVTPGKRDGRLHEVLNEDLDVAGLCWVVVGAGFCKSSSPEDLKAWETTQRKAGKR